MWLKPSMFCEESSTGKVKFRAFPKRVGLRILLLQSIDYFGTSEHYWVVEKKIRILISKTWMVGCCIYFHCMQMGLVKSMRFIFGDDWNDVPWKSLFWSLVMMLFLWNRGPWIFVYLYMRIAWPATAEIFLVITDMRTKSV